MSKKLPSTILLAYVGLFISNTIWAWAAPVIKVGLDHIPLFAFLFYRFLLVCIILLPFAIKELYKNPVHKSDVLNLFLLGLSGQASIIFIFWGLKYTTALDTTIIGLIVPMLTVAAGHYFFKEKINNYIKVGLALATFGTVLVVLEPLIGTNLQTDVKATMRLFGNGLVLVYNLCFLMYVVWSKMSLASHKDLVKKDLHFLHLRPFKKEYSGAFLIYFTFFVALMACMPLAIYEYFYVEPFSILQIDGVGILSMLYMSLVSSIIAYLVFEWSLKRSTVSDTAFFAYLHPLMALPVAYLLLGEVPTQLNLIGSGIIFLGVVIAERKNT